MSGVCQNGRVFEGGEHLLQVVQGVRVAAEQEVQPVLGQDVLQHLPGAAGQHHPQLLPGQRPLAGPRPAVEVGEGDVDPALQQDGPGVLGRRVPSPPPPVEGVHVEHGVPVVGARPAAGQGAVQVTRLGLLVE